MSSSALTATAKAVRKSLTQPRLTQLMRNSATLLGNTNISPGYSCQNSHSFSSETNRRDMPSANTIYQYNENVKDMTDEDLTDVTTIPGFTTLIHSMPKNESTPRNALVGKVVSDKMQKTVNVAVDRYRIVPKYRKRMKYTKKFFAHDEKEVCHEGDLVMIVPCQKMSRHKHFRVHEIIKRKGMFQDD